jgi:protein-tyrosine phosphatase
MKRILFVCTGNYYRSRFAEILFNHLAPQQRLKARAFSRGLEVFKQRNEGPISGYAREYLDQLTIPLPEPLTHPQQISPRDFDIADQIILLDRKEHHPMMEAYFPEYLATVDFWEFADADLHTPAEMLPLLRERVHRFLNEEIKKS